MPDETRHSSQSPSEKTRPEISCGSRDCRATVPEQLASENLCLLHYTLRVEETCSRMRRMALRGELEPEERAESAQYITRTSVRLAQVATSGLSVSDPLKKRVLSTLLTLMILRENLSRAAARADASNGAHAYTAA